MSADFELKQNDTSRALTDTLTLSDGTVPPLTGATVQFVMRSLASAGPTVNSPAIITNAQIGAVQYTPTASDTAVPGEYEAEWQVTFADGGQMTFPTVGYLSVEIEESLSSTGIQQLVSLPEVKDYLSMDRNDRRLDTKLTRVIHAVRPQVEAMCGPIIPTVYEEWHDGGQAFIQVRRRPSTGYGTSPILDLIGIEEFRGPTKYSLTPVADPGLGSIYTVHMDRLGKITRRTSGGGVIGYPQMPESVHVWYRAGQQTIPPNVVEGTLEWIRVNEQVTQATGRGMDTLADQQDMGPALKVGMPRYVAQMLAPTRRAPSIA